MNVSSQTTRIFYLNRSFKDVDGRLVKFGLTHLFDMQVPFLVRGNYVSVFYGEFSDPCTLRGMGYDRSLVIPNAVRGSVFDDFLRLNMRSSKSARGIVAAMRNIVRANLGEDLSGFRHLMDEFRTMLELETALRGIGNEV